MLSGKIKTLCHVAIFVKFIFLSSSLAPSEPSWVYHAVMFVQIMWTHCHSGMNLC